VLVAPDELGEYKPLASAGVRPFPANWEPSNAGEGIETDVLFIGEFSFEI
jgi:hypothetical protein